MRCYNYNIPEAKIQLELFKGKFPKKPKHTCENFGVLSNKENSIKFTTYSQKAWRERGNVVLCEACLHEHIYRLTKQVQLEVEHTPEEDWGYIQIGNKDFIKLKDRLRKKNPEKGTDNIKDGNVPNSGISYLAIPQGERLFLIHNTPELETSRTIPLSISKLFNLLKEAVLQMPPKTKYRSSRGFGRDYNGNKGFKTKQPEPEIKLTFKEPFKVRALLKNIEYKNGYYQIDIISLIDMLDENGIQYFVIYGREKLDRLKEERANEKDVEIERLLWVLRGGLTQVEQDKVQAQLGSLLGVTI